ncbi:MAG: hypothetical protein WC645_01290 [Candidatus Margulisiibacteriota bacterium]
MLRNGQWHTFVALGPLRGGSHSTVTKVVDVKDTEFVVKEVAGQLGREKLINEIAWLKSLPAGIADRFPSVVKAGISADLVYYVMPHYSLPSLREALFCEDLGREKALDVLSEVLNFMFSKVYPHGRAAADPTYAEEVLFRRVSGRMEELEGAAPLFADILAAGEVVFDGETYRNSPQLIEELRRQPEVVRRLQPPFVCLAHGNFHFDNILVNPRSSACDKFILIDPRGDAQKDPYHDMGKLLTSIYTGYDFVHHDWFPVNYDMREGKLIVNTASRPHPAMDGYQAIFKGFPQLLRSKGYFNAERDPDWELRVLIYQACHVLSFIPFHLKGDGVEKRAVLFYALGTKLLNECAALLKTGEGGYLSTRDQGAGIRPWYIK